MCDRLTEVALFIASWVVWVGAIIAPFYWVDWVDLFLLELEHVLSDGETVPNDQTF